MTEASHADVAGSRQRNARREDGIIYKGMAAVVFALVASLVLADLRYCAAESATATRA